MEISLEEKLENDRQAVQGGIEGRLPSSDASPEGKVTGPEDGAARGDEVEGQQQQQEYRGTTSQVCVCLVRVRVRVSHSSLCVPSWAFFHSFNKQMSLCV